jgi:hypothetical protein
MRNMSSFSTQRVVNWWRWRRARALLRSRSDLPTWKEPRRERLAVLALLCVVMSFIIGSIGYALSHSMKRTSQPIELQLSGSFQNSCIDPPSSEDDRLTFSSSNVVPVAVGSMLMCWWVGGSIPEPYAPPGAAGTLTYVAWLLAVVAVAVVNARHGTRRSTSRKKRRRKPTVKQEPTDTSGARGTTPER